MRSSGETIAKGAFLFCAGASAVMTASVFLFMITLGLPLFRESDFFLVWTGRWSPHEGLYGVGSMISGTLWIALLATALSLPLSLGTAFVITSLGGPRLKKISKRNDSIHDRHPHGDLRICGNLPAGSPRSGRAGRRRNERARRRDRAGHNDQPHHDPVFFRQFAGRGSDLRSGGQGARRRPGAAAAIRDAAQSPWRHDHGARPRFGTRFGGHPHRADAGRKRHWGTRKPHRPCQNPYRPYCTGQSRRLRQPGISIHFCLWNRPLSIYNRCGHCHTAFGSKKKGRP